MTDLATMRQLAAAVAALDHKQGDDLPMIGGDSHHPDVANYSVWLPVEAAAYALADAVAEIDRLTAELAFVTRELVAAADEIPGSCDWDWERIEKAEAVAAERGSTR